jgi:hypothetical protein
LAQIGVAAAIGRSIDIPILVRTLGQNLNQNGYNPNVPFTPDAELLAYLEGGLSGTGPDDLGILVNDFHLAWWRDSIPEMEYTSYLSFATIHTALEKHRGYVATIYVHPQKAKRPDFSSELNKPAYTWHPDVDRNLDNPYTRCRLYRAVALGAYDKLRDLRNMVHACETANQGERDLAARRAAGFNFLHEAAVMKGAGEAEAGPGNMETNRKGKGKEQDVASEEQTIQFGQGLVERSQDKWTWGSNLTYDDLRAIGRGVDRNCQVPHSGYDFDLKTGKLRGITSPNPNPDDIEDIGDPEVWFDELSPDFPDIRDLCSDEIPAAFYLAALHRATEPDSPFDPISADFESKHRAKLRMQDEANCPDSPSSTSSVSGLYRPFPSMRLPPKDYVRPPTSHALAARAVRLMPAPGSLTQGSPFYTPVSIQPDSPPSQVLLEPIYIPSDEESQLGGESLNIAVDDCGPEEAMRIVISDDSLLAVSGAGSPPDHHILVEDLDAAGSDYERPMTVFIPDSDDDEIDADAEIPMMIDSGAESEEVVNEDNPVMGIPTTVYMSESEESEDCGADDLPRVESGRDPHTGKFTPASFAHFEDVWLE